MLDPIPNKGVKSPGQRLASAEVEPMIEPRCDHWHRHGFPIRVFVGGQA